MKSDDTGDTMILMHVIPDDEADDNEADDEEDEYKGQHAPQVSHTAHSAHSNPPSYDMKMEHLSKMEGHTDLEISVRDGVVTDVKLKVSESKRFFTVAIRGQSALNVPQLVSRICGTCSIAHLLACTHAVENALNVEPSTQTKKLRELAAIGNILRDHAMHLYLFCLPDIFGKETVFDFGKKEEKILKKAFGIKSAANKLCTSVVGRVVHGMYTQIGGFSKLPTNEEMKNAAEALHSVREDVVDTIALFATDWKLEAKRDYIALVDPQFDFTDGVIRHSRGMIIPHEDFTDYLHRVVFPYSQSTGFQCLRELYRVGALARLNLNKDALNEETKKDVAPFLKRFPSDNIYDNLLAQAIEMLQCIDRSLEILEGLEIKDEKPVEIRETREIRKEGEEGAEGKERNVQNGIGVVEAPRGTLFYELSIDGTDDKHRIKDGTLVIPTAQNQLAMQCDIGLLVQNNISMDHHALEHEIEKLIRAYDPCFSCATHFLRVKWKES